MKWVYSLMRFYYWLIGLVWTKKEPEPPRPKKLYCDKCHCRSMNLKYREGLDLCVFCIEGIVVDPIELESSVVRCKWAPDSHDDYWNTDCGRAVSFLSGGPEENLYLFCPGCGKEISDLTKG